MTEAEWLQVTQPQIMLEHLRGKASDWKSRLFACACCCRLWHRLSDERTRNLVLMAERFADGQVSAEELAYDRARCRALVSELSEEATRLILSEEARAGRAETLAAVTTAVTQEQAASAAQATGRPVAWAAAF